MTEPCPHIVDDDEAIRDGLQWLFKTRRLASSTWPSAEAFLDAVQPDWQGCVVMDIRMGGMNGLACFDALRARGNTLPVVFITGHGDVPMAVSALKKGAFDFIEKPFNGSDLVEVVMRAMAADRLERARILERAAVSEKLASLTNREREVMDLILAGHYNKVIGDKLNISMRTVEVHRSKIFDKTGVRSAVELATLLKQSGHLDGS